MAVTVSSYESTGLSEQLTTIVRRMGQSVDFLKGRRGLAASTAVRHLQVMVLVFGSFHSLRRPTFQDF